MSSDERYTFRLRVGYADTDQAGVVHHASYLRYLEAARIEYLRHHGVSYREFEIDDQLALPVIEAVLRYKRPAFFDDVLHIEVWVGLMTRARLRFDSAIYRDKELLTDAQITLACVRTEDGRPTSLPSLLINACQDVPASTAAV
ncbi:MAG: acyl-CoA thioesterase [Myxococcales bacterium]|nr:acyl-CoA thioesterase [Myxococcales bacterium]